MKNLTLVLSVLALLGAGASAFFYVQIGDQKAELQQQLQGEQGRAANLSSQLSEASGKVEELEGQVTATNGKLEQATAKIDEIDAQLRQANRDLSSVKNQLQAKEQDAQSLTQRLREAQKTLVEYQAKATESGTASTDEKDEIIKKLKDQLAALSHDAGGISGDVETGPQDPIGLRTTVASVGPKSAFVVLNYGVDQGALTDQKLRIERHGLPIASVTISEVKEQYSIGQVTPGSSYGKLQKGDAAIVVNR